HDDATLRPERSMSERQLQLGVAGLGRAFQFMLPALRSHPRVRLAGAADPRPEARARFSAEFAAPAYESVDELCRDDAIEAIRSEEHTSELQSRLHLVCR